MDLLAFLLYMDLLGRVRMLRERAERKARHPDGDNSDTEDEDDDD
jgi:hypothetical protein